MYKKKYVSDLTIKNNAFNKQKVTKSDIILVIEIADRKHIEHVWCF